MILCYIKIFDGLKFCPGFLKLLIQACLLWWVNFTGIIETEASFKAARISVEQNHSLQAASFLQNVVFINLTLSEQEKIQRFETLSELYTQIGFIRKAAFCQRLAATRYVSPQNPTPNWNQCYNLMLQSFPGHKISLDPTEISNGNGHVGEFLKICRCNHS